MSVILQGEIDKLRKLISSLATRVEESVRKAALSILERQPELAVSVIDLDQEIDDMEVEVEEECLKILALHQPVARDLRYIVTVLKMNNDLERIGDLAKNCAQQSVHVAEQRGLVIPYDLKGMAEKVQKMLQCSLDALVESDSLLARKVLEADDEVDAIDAQMYPDVQAAIREHPEQMQSLIRLLKVAQNLERIGDHATNIAEDVIYMIEGNIVRHRRK